MKTVIYGLSILAGLAIALAAAVFILPSFIDWNDHRQIIAQEISKATGRTLVVEGDLNFGVLPTPYLKAEKVRLSNAPGATEEEILTLRAVRIQLGLIPLFKGRIEIADVELIRPVIELERFSDGSLNWSLSENRIRGPINAISRFISERTGIAFDEESIDLHQVRILDGSLNYRDARTGMDMGFRELSLEIGADGLQGPYTVRGSGMTGKKPLTLSARYDNEDAPGQVGIELQLDIAETQLRLHGTIAQGSGGPRLLARMQWEGESLSGLTSLLTGGDTPPFLDRAFLLTSSAAATEEEVRLEGLMFDLDGFKVEGEAGIAFGSSYEAAFALKSGQVSIDNFLVEDVSASGPPLKTDTGESADGDDPRRKHQPFDFSGIYLPNDVSVDFGYRADEILVGGHSVRSVDVSARLREGVLTLRRAGAVLPGESEVDVSGELTTRTDGPEYKGRMAMRAVSVRDLLASLGVNLTGIAPDRLRRAVVSADFDGNGSEARLANVLAEFDASRARGAATVFIRERPAFGVSVSVDRLDVDAYVPGLSKDADRTGAKVESPAVSAGQQPPGPLAYLAGFDANFLLRASSLSLRETPIRGLLFSGSLQNGELTVIDASIRSLGGAGVRLKGTVSDLGAVPSFAGRISAAAENLDGVARFLGVELPAQSAGLGKMLLRLGAKGKVDEFAVDTRLDLGEFRSVITGTVVRAGSAPLFDLSIEGRHPDAAALVAGLVGSAGTSADSEPTRGVSFNVAAKGGLDNLAVDGAGRLAGGEIGLKGVLRRLLDEQDFELGFSLEHNDASQLVQLFAPDYEFANSLLDRVSLSARVERDGAAFLVHPITAEIGEMKIEGTGVWKEQTTRPNIGLTLSTDVLPLSDILDAAIPEPDPRTAGLPEPGGDREPSGGQPEDDTADFDFLRLADISITVRADSLFYRQSRVDGMRTSVNVRDGDLQIDSLQGKMFGGDVAASGYLHLSETPKLDLEISFAGANLTSPLFGGADLDIASGSVDVGAKVSARGRSGQEMVRTLSGKGTLTLTDGALNGFDLKKAAGYLSGRGNPATTVLRVQDAMSGGQTKVSTFTAGFEISGGVARTEEMQLTSEAGSVSATGRFDFESGKLDAQARMKLNDPEGVPSYGMRLTGMIDDPERQYEFAALVDWLEERRIRKEPATSGSDVRLKRKPKPPPSDATINNATTEDAASVEPKKTVGRNGSSDPSGSGESRAGEGKADRAGSSQTRTGGGKAQGSETVVPADTLVDELIRSIR